MRLWRAGNPRPTGPHDYIHVIPAKAGIFIFPLPLPLGHTSLAAALPGDPRMKPGARTTHAPQKIAALVLIYFDDTNSQ